MMLTGNIFEMMSACGDENFTVIFAVALSDLSQHIFF